MTALGEIQERVADCRTYNFGMYNADKLAHDDAPRLVAALRAVEAVLAEEAVELGKTSSRLNQQMLDRHPDRDSAVAARYDAYAAHATHAAKMVRDTIRDALA